MIHILAKDEHQRVLYDKIRRVPVQVVIKMEGTWLMINKVIIHNVLAFQLQHDVTTIASVPRLTIIVASGQEASLVRTLQLITQVSK